MNGRLKWITVGFGEGIQMLRQSKNAGARNVYLYFYWLRQRELAQPESPEYAVANGFVVKHYHRIYGIPLAREERSRIRLAKHLVKLSQRRKLTPRFRRRFAEKRQHVLIL